MSATYTLPLEFDGSALGADIARAKNYELANMVKKAEFEGERDFCDCCNEYVPKPEDKIPLCCNTDDLAILGTGFPMYFKLMKNLAYILLGISVIVFFSLMI